MKILKHLKTVSDSPIKRREDCMEQKSKCDLLHTCVECLPGADRCLLASTLQLMLPVQRALNFNRGQLFQLLKPLQLTETLSATACCKARSALGLLQLYLHALCAFDVCTRNRHGSQTLLHTCSVIREALYKVTD